MSELNRRGFLKGLGITAPLTILGSKLFGSSPASKLDYIDVGGASPEQVAAIVKKWKDNYKKLPPVFLERTPSEVEQAELHWRTLRLFNATPDEVLSGYRMRYVGPDGRVVAHSKLTDIEFNRAGDSFRCLSELDTKNWVWSDGGSISIAGVRLVCYESNYQFPARPFSCVRTLSAGDRLTVDYTLQLDAETQLLRIESEEWKAEFDKDFLKALSEHQATLSSEPKGA